VARSRHRRSGRARLVEGRTQLVQKTVVVPPRCRHQQSPSSPVSGCCRIVHLPARMRQRGRLLRSTARTVPDRWPRHALRFGQPVRRAGDSHVRVVGPRPRRFTPTRRLREHGRRHSGWKSEGTTHDVALPERPSGRFRGTWGVMAQRAPASALVPFTVGIPLPPGSARDDVTQQMPPPPLGYVEPGSSSEDWHLFRCDENANGTFPDSQLRVVLVGRRICASRRHVRRWAAVDGLIDRRGDLYQGPASRDR
jgi:hypothetical protein